MVEGQQNVSYTKIDNTPKLSVYPEKLNKEVADLTGQMDLAKSLSKQGMCTPESAARDTAELLKSFDEESGIVINRAYSTQKSPASATSVNPDAIKTIQKYNKGAQDQINNTMNGFGKTFSSFPQGVQNFFKKIFEFLGFKDFFSSTGKDSEKTKDISNLLPKAEDTKILDTYGIKSVEGKTSGTTELQFGEKADITGTKLKDSGTKQEDSEKINIKGGKIILQEGDKISSINEGTPSGTVNFTIRKNDGSTEAYVLKGTKKAEGEQPKPI